MANPKDYSAMRNRRMAEKLATGRAIDVSQYPRTGRYYILPRVVEGKDYCDAKYEAWVWSIGERISDGVVLASLSADLYQNPDFKCVWLR